MLFWPPLAATGSLATHRLQSASWPLARYVKGQVRSNLLGAILQGAVVCGAIVLFSSYPWWLSKGQLSEGTCPERVLILAQQRLHNNT